MSGRVVLDFPFLGSLLELPRGSLPERSLPERSLPGLPCRTVPERLPRSGCYSAQVSFLIASEYESLVAVVMFLLICVLCFIVES